MSDQALSNQAVIRKVFSYFVTILGSEHSYYSLAIVYGLGISALSLALPLSVQMLVNTIANTALGTPLAVLALTLFALLLTAGLLNALRIHLMDLFSRRFYARMVSEIALRAIYALNPFFQDSNKGTLFNRYFDILIVHKTVPYLLVGGFTTVLQAGFGFVLVSLYHPLFLGFVIVLMLLIWLIWLAWGGRAIRSAVQVSHQKHATAAWLEGLGASNGFFKSQRHINEALTRTDAATAEYIDRHQRHFRHHFAQILCFLVLYASASAGLLGLGGWLVIQGELSLGQLVAAEVVLSVAFYGISQMGTYLAYFYELCGALDELGLFYEVEQEEPAGDPVPFEGDGALAYVNARGDARGRTTTLNFSIPAGARIYANVETHGIQREMTNLLKRLDRPRSGFVTLGGQDVKSIQAHELRRHVIVLDRPNAIELTIREYLNLSAQSGSSVNLLQALDIVGLDIAIAQLEDGLDTRIAPTGWPLTITETMQMKLAAALIAQPRVLVLGELYDTLPDRYLSRALDLLRNEAETTVIYFSNRPPSDSLDFDGYLFLGHQSQRVHDSYTGLCRHRDATSGNAGHSEAHTYVPGDISPSAERGSPA
ncbi:MAG: ABC transporter ATP-binding protein [Gammaproteobacteria bacterium]|nr:ABC transporter ATP-binding protein [Pseudomonadales bacterium]MCP5346152.1 ABC transporter ATP-binding protein [Pseudomonadales bacterium]